MIPIHPKSTDEKVRTGGPEIQSIVFGSSPDIASTSVLNKTAFLFSKRKESLDEETDYKRSKIENEYKPQPIQLGFSAFAAKSSSIFSTTNTTADSTVFGSSVLQNSVFNSNSENVFNLSNEKEGLDNESSVVEEEEQERINDSLFSDAPTIKVAEITVASGEEEEKCIVEVRAKLFKLSKQDEETTESSEKIRDDHPDHLKFKGDINDKAGSNLTSKVISSVQFYWKELGSGPLHLNTPKARSNKSPSLPRLVMRRDGVMKLLLNTYIYPSFPFEMSSEKSIRFTSPNSDYATSKETSTYLLKFRRCDECSDFFDTIQEHLPQEKTEK